MRVPYFLMPAFAVYLGTGLDEPENLPLMSPKELPSMMLWDEDGERAVERIRAMVRGGGILGVEPPTADLEWAADGPRARVVSASDVAPERVEWLWPDRIPLGMLTLFSGDPKLGKSLATLALAAAVTRGGSLPGAGGDGLATAPRGSVILLSAEDDPARTISPRLRAAGAVMERVKIVSSIIDPVSDDDPDGADARGIARERMPSVQPEDLRVIERHAARLGDCRLIVFDPISAYLGGPDVNRGTDLRRVLMPLAEMARRLGAAVVLVTHHNKRGASGTNGKYRVLGSIAYVGACRANFLFLKDPDDPSGRRVLMLDNGGNLAPSQPALAYVIRDEGTGPFCDWLPETIDLDADAALARSVKVGESGAAGRLSRRRECLEWLRGYLADGPKPAAECERAALAAGFSDTLLRRARVDLAVRCARSGFGKGSCSQWSLPEASIGTLQSP
jgi:hypothetical protein